MGRFGGAQKGAGHPKGKLGKRTLALRAIADEALAEGVTPIEVMLENMRFYHSESDKLLATIIAGVENGKSPASLVEALSKLMWFRAEAQKCAVDAAPYLHPRLSSIAV